MPLSPMTSGELRSLADVTPLVEDLRKEHVRVAYDALMGQAKRDRNWLKVSITVDGKRDRDAERVKPFGLIEMAPQYNAAGFQAAVDLAASIIAVNMPRIITGTYARSFIWTANGRTTTGKPNVSRLGLNARVTVENTAPYANMLEVNFLPSGIIWAAYNAVRRSFGPAVVDVRYYYTSRSGGSHPVLQIRPATANLKTRTSGKRPGTSAKRRARRQKATGKVSKG